jgi:hypothetical protein
MRISNLSGWALSICAAAAMLAGCSGSPAALAPGANPQNVVTAGRPAGAGSWMLSEATSNELVYISESNGVGVYSTTGKNVGMLKGLNNPGICSDTQGNIWVTYGDSLLEYSHGGAIPIAQAYLPSGFGAFSCAVDPTTGDLAVTDQGNVAVFQNIYDPPQTYTDSDFYAYAYVTYDNQGNLFINGTHDKTNLFAELPAGSGTLGTISMDEKFGKIGGIQWDGQYLAVGDSLDRVVYQMSVSNGHGTTQGSTHFHGWRPKFKAIVPFAIQSGMIVLAFASDTVGYFNYPQGGRATRRFTVYTTNGAVAISVLASRSHRRQP